MHGVDCRRDVPAGANYIHGGTPPREGHLTSPEKGLISGEHCVEGYLS